MSYHRKHIHSHWQLFLSLVLILCMTGWKYSSASAAGATYYVNNTNVSCSDLNAGTTMALPFCTIGKGASLAVAGDTVQVLAGTYAETVNGPNSGTAGLPITYSAAPGVTVTGNGLAISGGGFRMSGKSYIVVDGFTITGTDDYGIYTFGSNNITITNNHVSYSGSPASGSTRTGIYINSTSSSTISGNTSDHNSSNGILLTNGSNNNLVSNNVTFANAEQWQRNATGIHVTGAGSANNIIIHNVAYANEDTGLQFYSGAHDNIVVGNLSYGNGDHGIDFNAAPNNIVVGNTVQGNHTAGINFEGAVAPASSGATIMNNISVDNGINPITGQKSNIRVDALSVANTTMDYNLVYLSGAGTSVIQWNGITYATLAAFQAAVPGQEVHGIQANPLFVAPVGYANRPPAVVVGNYHIQAGSPAIDSANSSAPSQPSLDLDGNARIDDPATSDTGAGVRLYDDRGAYEFQPPAALPTVTTEAVTAIDTATATGNGTITALGIPNPSQHGVVWSTAPNPTTADSSTTDGAVSAVGAFTSAMTGLVPNTTYHVRAYATNSTGTAYGADVTFTTSAAAPTVTTTAASSVTTTSATLNGTVNANNSDTTVTFEYGLTSSYGTTITAAQSPVTGTANVAVDFALSGLVPNTTYHFRVNGVNAGGTVNGTDLTFTTNLAPPVVTTNAATALTTTGATLNGTVNANNSSTTVTFEYGLTAAYGTNVTAAESPVTGSTNTAVSYALGGLLPNTTYHYRVTGVNAGGAVNGSDLTFTTSPVAPTITSSIPSSGTVGIAYTHTFTATGVPAPTFSLTGSLPAGLSFDGIDTISGTPTSGGTFAGLSVTAMNGVSPDDIQNFSLTINTPTIALAPITLPNGTVTVLYNQTITASGGTSPYAFAVTAGALPSGLTLSASGVLSGIPSAGGTSNFTVTATDSSTGTGPYTGSQAYSITINNNTAVTIDQAAGQPDPTNNTTINFTVVFSEAVTGFATGDVSFAGSTAGGPLTGTVTEIAPNDGTTYNVAVTGMTNTGIVVATVPAGVATGSLATNAASTSTDNTVTYDAANPTVASTTLTTNYTGTGPGSFVATFNKGVADPPGNTGTDDVTNPANYVLINKGTNGVVDTASCAGGVVADDNQITVTSVVYNSATFQATVTLVDALPVGSYRLFICGTTSIVDVVGNRLNGGTDFTFDFVVLPPTQTGGSGNGRNGNNRQNNSIPTTGFSQNKVTTLPIQPADKAYTSTDLWLEIPKLKVKLSIVGIPQTKDGWDVTWLNKEAGWLNGSAFPTWKGNSVLTGHAWSPSNQPGPFVGLVNLTYGDQIKIHAFGQVYIYEVVESKVVQPSNLAAAFKHEEKSWLTLVTCENYQEKTETYASRRLVRAVLVSVVDEK